MKMEQPKDKYDAFLMEFEKDFLAYRNEVHATFLEIRQTASDEEFEAFRMGIIANMEELVQTVRKAGFPHFHISDDLATGAPAIDPDMQIDKIFKTLDELLVEVKQAVRQRQADESPEAQEIRKLLKKDKQANRKKNYFIMVLPTLITIVLWGIIILVNTLIALPRSQRKIDITLLSKTNGYEDGYDSSMSSYLDTHIILEVEIKNNTNYGIDRLSMNAALKKGAFNSMYSTRLHALSEVAPGESAVVFFEITPQKCTPWRNIRFCGKRQYRISILIIN